jgi:hypothetical protein
MDRAAVLRIDWEHFDLSNLPKITRQWYQEQPSSKHIRIGTFKVEGPAAAESNKGISAPSDRSDVESSSREGPRSAPPAASPPGSPGFREYAFKELVLDARTLAATEAPVEVIGIYQGFGTDIEVLYGPGHTIFGVSDDSVRLLTDDSPREVREFLYRCRQRNIGCRVKLTGRMTTCALKINSAAEFPCLRVDEVEATATPPRTRR